MADIKIKIVDYTYSKIVKGMSQLFPCLSYEYEKNVPCQFGSKSIIKRKALYNSRSFKFYTGYINRIKKYCSNNNLTLEIDDSFIEFLEPERDPYLSGKNIKTGKYSYEQGLINLAIKNQRGIILAATGSGKTALMLGILSCFPSYRALFLADSHTPISQFKEGLKNHRNDINIDNISISTIQALNNKNPKEYETEYDIILIDEVHSGFGTGDNFSVPKSMYGKVLKVSQAPIRLGFTATLPDSKIAQLNLEGLLGPVIGTFDFQEGIERGVIVKPIIKVRKLPKNSNLKRLSYSDVYNEGVVNNRALNRFIVEDAKHDIESGLSTLILVTEIAHAENILKIAKLYNLDLIFVRGSTDKDVREEIRHAMIDKKIMGVIATAVFKKALDIPTLGSVINGCSGKSESQLLQIIGRGVRSAEGKTGVIIRDYFNPSNRYLVEHFGHRLSIYFEEGWL